VLSLHWTPQQVLAVFEILDKLCDQLWDLPGPQIQQAMREDQCATSAKPRGALG
jgi:hypothetical protein